MTPRTTLVGWHLVVALAAATLPPACAGMSSKPQATDAPPPVSEEILPDAASLITGLPGVNRDHHNPAAFVRVANHLRALGEGQCLEALERASDERSDAVIALICVLFDSTQDGEPRPTLAHDLERVSQVERVLREQHPDYPVVWVADIPIWAEGLTGFVGVERLGRRQSTLGTRVRPFLDWAKQDARLAESPLHLPDDPAAAVSAWFENDEDIVAWKMLREFRSGPDFLLGLARHQSYAALEGLLDDEVAAGLGYLPKDTFHIGDDYWSGVEAITATSGLRWDREEGRYAQRDE